MTGFADDPDLAVITHETDRLLETIHTLDDDAVRGPSLCPGWTRAHVLTHIARNADGLRNVLLAGAAGGDGAMYESQAQRAAEIEAGAGRSASELESDVEISDDNLLDALAATPPEALPLRIPRVRHAEDGGHQILFTVAKVPTLRLREVVFHHIDLDAGYTFDDAPRAFVLRELGESAQRFGDGPPMLLDGGADGHWRYGADGGDTDPPTISGTPADLLAWVTGRGHGTGLTSSTGTLPTLHEWG